MSEAGAAAQRLASFDRRFGPAHRAFACHAAFPLALTPDLLYRLWAAFFAGARDPAVRVPWVAVADLLLSGLCRETGQELFQMEPAVQDRLMRELADDPRFGRPRIAALSDFVLRYYGEGLGHIHGRDFVAGQQDSIRWLALAWANPERASARLLEEARRIAAGDADAAEKPVRLMALTDRLAVPLQGWAARLDDVRATLAAAASTAGHRPVSRGHPGRSAVVSFGLRDAETRLDHGRHAAERGQTAEVVVNVNQDLEEKSPALRSILPALISRNLQINSIIERLEEMMPGGGTLLVVVPCCAADMPEALILRCVHVEFIRHFGGIGAWLYKRLKWPEGAGSVASVLRDLRDALGFPRDYRQPDIEATVARLDRHLCFAHVVDGEMWRVDNGALIQKWVSYLSGEALTAGPNYLVVGFLCLVLTEHRTDENREIEAYIDTLLQGTTSKSGRVLVTKPLGLIREPHVGEWASTVSIYLEDDMIEVDLLGVTKHLFTPEKSQYRLREIWDKLSDGVTAAVNRRPIRFK